jgi:hypothetical protein
MKSLEPFRRDPFFRSHFTIILMRVESRAQQRTEGFPRLWHVETDKKLELGFLWARLSPVSPIRTFGDKEQRKREIN